MEQIDDDNANVKKLLDKIKQEFPTVSVAVPVLFSSWKLSDLKRFLVVVNKIKGHSKSKKAILVEIATKFWKGLCSTVYFSSTDAKDEDILSETGTSLASPVFSHLVSSTTTTTTNSSSSPPLTSSATSSSRSSSPSHSSLVKRNINYKYPDTPEGMSLSDFEKWTVSQLHDYLSDRCINKSGNKPKLVQNVYGCYLLQLPITVSDPQKEKEQIEADNKLKLILEDGMVTLPNPAQLKGDWVDAPANLPDTVFDQVKGYLVKNNGGKAFIGGKSLLKSEHLFNLMVHTISPNIRYSFVQGLCYPEQKFKSKTPYKVWICLHKDTGEVITGDCACTAG